MFTKKISRAGLRFFSFLQKLLKMLIPQLLPVAIKFVWSSILKFGIVVRNLHYRKSGRFFESVFEWATTITGATLVVLMLLFLSDFLGVEERAKDLLKIDASYRSMRIFEFVSIYKAIVDVKHDSTLSADQINVLNHYRNRIGPQMSLDDARKSTLGIFYTVYYHRQKILVVLSVLLFTLIFINIRPKENRQSKDKLVLQYVLEQSRNEFFDLFNIYPGDPNGPLQIHRVLCIKAKNIDDLCVKRAQIRKTLSLTKEDKQKQVADIVTQIETNIDAFYRAIMLVEIFGYKIEHRSWKKYVEPTINSNQ